MKNEDLPVRTLGSILVEIYLNGANPNKIGCDKTVELAKQEILGLLPSEREIGKECPQPYSVFYETAISEIKGWNACLKKVKEKLGA